MPNSYLEAFNADDIRALEGALCYEGGYDPALWFGEDGIGRGGSGNNHANHARIRAAKAVCSACPVRLRCLAIALKNNDREGIYGGLTPEERKAINEESA